MITSGLMGHAYALLHEPSSSTCFERWAGGPLACGWVAAAAQARAQIRAPMIITGIVSQLAPKWFETHLIRIQLALAHPWQILAQSPPSLAPPPAPQGPPLQTPAAMLASTICCRTRIISLSATIFLSGKLPARFVLRSMRAHRRLQHAMQRHKEARPAAAAGHMPAQRAR